MLATVAPPCVTTSAGAAASVLKPTVAAPDVAPPAQLLTIETVYILFGVKFEKLTELALAGNVWVVVAGEVVVVGAGIVGAALAANLAREKLSVVVIDKLHIAAQGQPG